MAKERERKFLVTGDAWRQGEAVRYRQGYLNTDPERTVRVRIAGNKAFLTIKGITVGCSRDEFEYPIPFEDAEALLALCEASVICKDRRTLRVEGFVWEVDEFFGDNQGLILAEIELFSEDQAFFRPDWVGREVTGDIRYYNAALAEHPFKNWT
ncbi:MAG: CYTH domain-containing protein [Spirochaetales bacterium]|nr:CYTH domain-containing protein [Spirochaetales bacterium]